ncbi:MAG TPA: NUDIX domain-containing protein, partial [Anaerolineae bacterium]|nr:NUDIX domain-containing protein [Anaerolineae bacterium]
GVMELGESAETTAIREIKEETGLDVKVNHLIGVYTNYFAQYANGDRAQTIVFAFHCTILGGELSADRKETFDLAFFDPKEAPRLFSQDHRDLLEDGIAGRIGVFR